MRELLRRLSFLIHRRRLNDELQDEMEFHREMMARAGQKNFGNTLRMREQAYEAWGWTWLDRLMQDLRFGVRILARSPGFTLMAVSVLAIGIGVNATAFSFFNMVALMPMPVKDGDRIVRLERKSPTSYNSEMAYPSFLFYKEHAKTLSAAIAVLGVPPLQIDDDMQLSSASFATPNYFSELGTRTEYGRALDPETDGKADAAPVVVLSYGMWKQRFGSDPGVVGRTIHLNGKAVTVVGVLPFEFASLGGQTPDMWLAMGQQPYFIERSTVLQDWEQSSVRMWGKLAPGVSATAAEQEMRALTDQLRKVHPKVVFDGEYLQASPGGHLQVMTERMYSIIGMVGVLTLLILVVSCANVGGLMVARAIARQQEIGIRLAIGAGRWRIFRQLCTESLLLGGIGAVAGLGLSTAVLKLVLTQTDAPGWISPVPDWQVVLFTTGITLVATMFFGLMPALQIARQRQQKTMFRQVLVGVQIAASCVLLIVSTLLLRATQRAIYSDPGFGYEQLTSVDPQLGRHGYTAAQAKVYLDEMESRLRPMPGVSSVALVRLPPLGHTVSNQATEIDGRKVTIYPNWVTPDLFHTMAIPLRMGRTFNPGEKHVVVVSESFARQQWRGKNPLGQTLGEGEHKDMVIGVVADAHINALSDDDALEEYYAAQTEDMPGMVAVVRSNGDAGALAQELKALSMSLDPAVFPEVREISKLYRDNVKTIGTVAGIVSLVGMVAVGLAATGLVGLVAFIVTQKTKEIAIRIALGAQPGSVLYAVLRQFLWPLPFGLVAGTGAAAFGSKLLRIGLYGVSNLDAASYLAALFLLGATAMVAMLLPAARTLRLDVAAALHHQ